MVVAGPSSSKQQTRQVDSKPSDLKEKAGGKREVEEEGRITPLEPHENSGREFKQTPTTMAASLEVVFLF